MAYVLFVQTAPSFLRRNELEQAIPLSALEDIASQQKERFTLLLVNPGIGNAADVFASFELCVGVVVVGATQTTRKVMNELDLVKFVSESTELPTKGLETMVVLWDDTMEGSVKFSDNAFETLRTSRMLVLRKPYTWNPPAADKWEKKPLPDNRTALFTYMQATPLSVAPMRREEVSVRVSMITPQELSEWRKRLELFLRTFLANFVTAPSIDAYFTPKFLMTWYEAFTHEFVDPDANYETLEFSGDVALENAIAKYLIARFPKASKGQYNEMKRMLVQKQGLKVVGRNLGLTSNLLTFKDTQHISEDVVESFLGALSRVSDQIVPGLGDVNVYNFVVWHYNKQDISPEREGRMPDKTIVNQIFEKLFDQKSETVKAEEQKLPSGGVLVQIVVPQTAVDTLRTVYKKNIQRVLGETTGTTSKAANATAYQNARVFLERAGLTMEWADMIHRKREFSTTEMKPIYDKAMRKAQTEGYVDLVVLKSTTMAGKEGTMVGVAGVMPSGKRVTVAIGEGTNRYEAMTAAMTAYIK